MQKRTKVWPPQYDHLLSFFAIPFFLKKQSSSNFQTLILCLLDIFWLSFMSCSPGVPKFWPFSWRGVKKKFIPNWRFFLFLLVCAFIDCYSLFWYQIAIRCSKTDENSLFCSNKLGRTNLSLLIFRASNFSKLAPMIAYVWGHGT